MPKHKSEPVGPDGYSRWTYPAMTAPYNVECCDCGLVHTIELKVSKIVSKTKDGHMNLKILPEGEYQVAFRAKRNNRATGQVHRYHKAKGD